MEIGIWTQRYFSENSILQWNCPQCKSKTLEFVKNKFISEETQDSKLSRKENPDFYIEDVEVNVSGQIICKNCKELIFFIGEGSPEQVGYYDYELDELISEYETTFTLKYVHPTINLFEIPDKTPELVKFQVAESFRLYWTDLESCANKIRIALEVLMDENKLKRFKNIKGRRLPISLHKRIEEFSNIEVRDVLLAIKWIGNAGSHSNNKLETIDILETYKLFEFALVKLYDNHEREVKSIAKEINKRRGIRKR